VYLIFWLFTIYLSNIQKVSGLEPVLPVTPQDGEGYISLVQSILEGNGFSSGNQINTLRSPGYPAFVALIKYTTGSYFSVTLIQILLVFYCAVLIRKLGILFDSGRAGEVAASFFILNPLVLTLSLIILTDILFLFLFLLGFYFAYSSRYNRANIIGASIIFAMAIYVRPMGVFALPVFAAPFLASKLNMKEKMKSIAAMVFILLMAVSPWIYRNYRLTGVADFSSFRAINLAAYAAPMFLSNQNHTTLAEERLNIEKSIGVPRLKWEDLRYSKDVSLAAERIILQQPFSYLKYHLVSSLPFLFSSSIQDALDTYKYSMHITIEPSPSAVKYLVNHDWKLFFGSITKVWWKVTERAMLVFIYLVAICGVWKERKKWLTWVFVFIPAYLMILSGPVANARYAVQALPFILLLFYSGLLYIKAKIKRKKVIQENPFMLW